MSVPEIEPGAALANLIRSCEVYCVSECCGIAAFSFSPLNVAAHLSRLSGEISDPDAIKIFGELDDLFSRALSLPADAQGYVCTVKGTNQLFSIQDLRALIDRMKWAVREAASVVSLSNKMEVAYEAGLKCGASQATNAE